MIGLLTIGIASVFLAGTWYEKKDYFICLMGMAVGVYSLIAAIGKIV